MKRIVLPLMALVMPLAAMAQSTLPITATPLLPPAGQIPSPVLPPPAASAPDTPTNSPGGATAATPQPIPGSWLPQSNAVLQLLDKVNAQNTMLTVKVGQSAAFGTLTIQVQACDVRPTDQPQDATAFLTIADSHADAPGFRGWMLANNPSLSMLQHPIYDVRVVGCRA